MTNIGNFSNKCSTSIILNDPNNKIWSSLSMIKNKKIIKLTIIPNLIPSVNSTKNITKLNDFLKES